MADNYTCPNCGATVMRWQNNCTNCNCNIDWSNVPNEPIQMDVGVINSTQYNTIEMNIVDAIKKFFRTILSMFSGRARRKEYWAMVLFHIFLFVPSTIITLLVKISPAFIILNLLYTYVVALYMMVAALPATALSIKRLHDIGKSGWWLLLSLIPFVGGIILLIWMCKDGDKFENKYGTSTKYVSNK